jgi:hypothetical protein
MGPVRWRILWWAAAALAAAGGAGLLAEVATAGLGRAAGLAGVIGGFCELGALVLGVAGLARDRRSARGSAADAAAAPAPGPEPSSPGSQGAAVKYVVDSRGAAGVLIGDGGIQVNESGGWPGRRVEH